MYYVRCKNSQAINIGKGWNEGTPMNWLRMRGTRRLRCTGEGRLKGHRQAKKGGKITTTEGVKQKKPDTRREIVQNKTGSN